MRTLALVSLLDTCACARTPAPPPAHASSPWEQVGVRVVDGVPQLGEVEIELTRDECYGWCPVYSVKLSGDGTLAYTGRSYVKTKGEHHDVIDPQKLLPLLERFQELDFLARGHACGVIDVDNSHARVALRIGARSKSVEDRVVARENDMLSPEDLAWHRKMYDLEQAIDSAANIDFWIGPLAEREAHTADWR